MIPSDEARLAEPSDAERAQYLRQLEKARVHEGDPRTNAVVGGPSDAEREAQDRVGMFIDFCALNKFGLDGWPPRTVAQLTAHFTLVLNERDEARRERDEAQAERDRVLKLVSAAGATVKSWGDKIDQIEAAEDANASLTAQVEEMREALEQAIGRCLHHAEFCEYEADHGGSQDLRERAKGARHLAEQIRGIARKAYSSEGQ